MDSYVSPTTEPIYRGTQVVWYLLGFLEAILAFRFVLKLLGANPTAGFTDLLYSLSYPFVAPFLNVFRVGKLEGSVVEWTTLLAMLVYWLLALGVLKLLLMSRSVSTPEAAAKLEAEDA